MQCEEWEAIGWKQGSRTSLCHPSGVYGAEKYCGRWNWQHVCFSQELKRKNWQVHMQGMSEPTDWAHNFPHLSTALSEPGWLTKHWRLYTGPICQHRKKPDLYSVSCTVPSSDSLSAVIVNTCILGACFPTKVRVKENTGEYLWTYMFC